MKDKELLHDNKKSNVLPFSPLAKGTKKINGKKTYDEIHFYDLTHVLEKYVMRANNPKKRLSLAASCLAVHYYSMINDSREDFIYINHAYISNNFTHKSEAQNRNYHKQLRDLFDIQSCQSIMIDGEQYYMFRIQFSKNGELLLNKLLDDSFVLKEKNLLHKLLPEGQP